jgi:hypothetical protein
VYNILNATGSILSSFLYESGNTPQVQPLLAGDGNLYGTTFESANSQQAQGSIYEYMLGDTPAPVALTASASSITLGQDVKLTFTATNAFSNSLKTCFLTDNISGDAPILVNTKGSRKETPKSAGTVTYGYTCGGVESATQTITVNP